MSEMFEVVIFTASHSSYANVVLNILDPNNEFITYRLFRDHCLQTKEQIYIKDLRIIANRKLSDMVIVDNATYSFGFQLENGIPVVPYYDQSDDTELLRLMNFLEQMNEAEDVRIYNNNYFKYDILTGEWSSTENLIEKLFGFTPGDSALPGNQQ